MADNSQNTIAGTSNGGNLINSMGNGFLDAISKLSNIAFTGLDAYGSFQEKLAAAKEAGKQKTQPPQQTTPIYNITSPADWLSNPGNVQNLLLYATAATFFVAGIVYFVKKK